MTVTTLQVLDATGDVVATGGVTGLHLLQHHLHLAADPPLTPGPALTPAATDLPLAVDVTTIADMAVADTTAPHPAASGHTLVLTVAHPHQTGTHVTDATGHTTGPAPGLRAFRTDTEGLRDCHPNHHPGLTGATRGPNLQGTQSV